MSTQVPLALQEMSDEQFSAHVLQILDRELGADGLARFLRVSKNRGKDFTRDRHKWQKGLTVRQIMEDIEKHRGTRQAG